MTRTANMEALTDVETRLVVEEALDLIIESAAEFVGDDGPLGAPEHVADLAAAQRISDVLLRYMP